MKSQVLFTVWCNISGEAAGEIGDWSLLGVKGLTCLHSSANALIGHNTCLPFYCGGSQVQYIINVTFREIKLVENV